MSFVGKNHKEIWEQVHAPKNPTRTTRKQREAILNVLMCAEKPLSQKEIAERAGLPLPVVCRVLKYLLKRFNVFRLGYKHEPHKPYRYVLNDIKALEMIKQHFRCPVCDSDDLYHLLHNIGCRKCNTLLFAFCLQIVDPDDVSFLLEKVARELGVIYSDGNRL